MLSDRPDDDDDDDNDDDMVIKIIMDEHLA